MRALPISIPRLLTIASALILAQVAYAVSMADLSISKTASTPIAMMGSTVTYTVLVKNIGTLAASNVTITDQLPANNVFVPALSDSSWTEQNGVLSCSIGSLAANQTASLVVACSYSNPLLRTVSTVQSQESDINPSDNTFSFSKNVAIEYPYLKSITQLEPPATNAPKVRYLLGFSKPVTGINKADFKVHTTGTVTTTPAVSAANAELTSYTLQLQNVTGNGLLWADLNDDNSIKDSNGEPFGGPATGLLPLGKIYSIDHILPESQANSAAATVPPGKQFYVTFVSLADASGSASVELWYRKGSSGPFSLFGISGNGYFLVDVWSISPGGDGEYQLYTIAKDKAGNTEAPPASPDLIVNFKSETGAVSWTKYNR